MALLLNGVTTIIRTADFSFDAEGWDVKRLNRLVRAPSPENALSIAGCQPGLRDGNMICVTGEARHVKAGYYECTGDFKGIKTAKPWKRVLRTFPDKTRGIITINGSPPYAQEVEVNENMVGVSVYQVVTNPPPLSWVGRNGNPIGGASVPQSRWTRIQNPLLSVPYGWVIDAIECEELPQSFMSLVRVDYVFYQRYKPGSASFQ